MNGLTEKIEAMDWQQLAVEMHENGYVVVPDFLAPEQCQQLIGKYDDPNGYRKTVVMERYRFGLGEYKYFDYPLPGIIQTVRENLYPKLAPIANLWMKMLKISRRFPDEFQDLQAECYSNGQLKPTALILKYGEGGFNTLHQDLYGEIYFPLQTVFMLNEPDVDFEGGEFVLTQQVPRAQSRAIVLKPRKGDMIIFTTNFRPIKGARGYYRANMRHGVSAVHSGERHTAGVIFHDAVS
ncbi:MAG: prolyl 4-hydroxylase subunit alpha [Hyphomicrobiales bacterium]|nr:MAG: prolyl 4-hydroxylase subunit alpha [Hyphomicrobiales bacterium]